MPSRSQWGWIAFAVLSFVVVAALYARTNQIGLVGAHPHSERTLLMVRRPPNPVLVVRGTILSVQTGEGGRLLGFTLEDERSEAWAFEADLSLDATAARLSGIAGRGKAVFVAYRRVGETLRAVEFRE